MAPHLTPLLIRISFPDRFTGFSMQFPCKYWTALFLFSFTLLLFFRLSISNTQLIQWINSSGSSCTVNLCCDCHTVPLFPSNIHKTIREISSRMGLLSRPNCTAVTHDMFEFPFRFSDSGWHSWQWPINYQIHILVVKWTRRRDI